MADDTRQSLIKEVGVWFSDLSKEFPNDEVFGTVIRGMITRLKQGEIPPRVMPKIVTSPLSIGLKDVFSQLDKLRGYRPPKRGAEAASIMRRLKKGYTTQQIIECWQKLKSDKFYQDKELYMMTVESQIGAMTNTIIKGKQHYTQYMVCLKCGLRKETWRLASCRGICPECGDRLLYEITNKNDLDKFVKGKYGHMVQR